MFFEKNVLLLEEKKEFVSQSIGEEQEHLWQWLTIKDYREHENRLKKLLDYKSKEIKRNQYIFQLMCVCVCASIEFNKYLIPKT